MDECGLYNISCQGHEFTWTGIRDGEVIRERLECALVNYKWMQAFPRCQGFNLDAVGSDHSPIVLWTEFVDKKGTIKFKFEANWVKEVECADVVKLGWNVKCEGSYWFILARKLKNCWKMLIDWCVNNKRGNKKKIKDLLKDICVLQQGIMTLVELEQCRDLKIQVGKALELKEIFWHQRARVNWINAGDKNTKFFHQITMQRRQNNKVLKIKGDDESWLEDEDEIMRAFVKFYEDLFSSTRNCEWEEVLSYMPRLVSAEDNLLLIKEVTDEKIEKAVFMLGALKEPGPDGLSGLFFQKFREIDKDDVCKAVKGFFPWKEVVKRAEFD